MLFFKEESKKNTEKFLLFMNNPWSLWRSCEYSEQNADDVDGYRYVYKRRDMDVGKREKIFPYVDDIDGNRFIDKSPREQPFSGVTRGWLLSKHRRGRIKGQLSKVLSNDPNDIRTWLVVRASIGRNSKIRRSSRSFMGCCDGGRILEIQRNEIIANDH